jgi:hypothetical protein
MHEDVTLRSLWLSPVIDGRITGRKYDMANQQKGQERNQNQGRNQPGTAHQNPGQQDMDIGKDVQHAGRERNTIGQTEQQASYWREQYRNEPYVTKGEKFEQYSPAYRTGYEGRSQYAGQRFEDVENNLERDYINNRGDSTLGWDKAKQACRAAWDRADQFVSSQTDRQQGR